MARKFKFTMYHGVALSLCLHAAVVAPFVVHLLDRQQDEIEPLVIEVQGLVADDQSEEKTLQETKAEATPVAKPPPLPPETPPPPPPQAEQPVPEEDPPPDQVAQQIEPPQPVKPQPPKPVKATTPPAASSPSATPASQTESGVNNVKGVEEEQSAQTLKQTQKPDDDRLTTYVKLMAKKVQGHLIYPEGHPGLHGIARVSFTILSNGEISPASLRIVESSGQSVLDDAALRTIQASAPFGSPPQPIAVTIGVAFGRKK